MNPQLLQPEVDVKYQSEKRCDECNLIKGFEDFYRNKNTRILNDKCLDCERKM